MTKVKQYAPWNIKPGMQTALGSKTANDYINRYRIVTVANVVKSRNYFNGESKWTVTFDNGETWNYYGKYKSLRMNRFDAIIE
jgi:hypothetical protein